MSNTNITIFIYLSALLLLFACIDTEEIVTKKSEVLIEEVDAFHRSNEQEVIINPVIRHPNGKIFNLKEILAGKSRLILVFSEKSCSFCIEHSLNFLKKDIQNIGRENVILLGDFISRHSHLVFSNLFDMEMYSIHDPSFGLETEINEPYFFLIGPNLQVRDIFVPLKSNPKRTTSYLNRISEMMSK